MLIIAHRSGSDRYPELSLQSARQSLELGADYLEIDVRFTIDQVPVICHDADTLHLFGINQKVKQMSYEAFMALRYQENNAIKAVSLEDYFRNGLKPLLLHIKEGGKDLYTILDLIEKYAYHHDVILGVTNLVDVDLVKDNKEQVRILAFVSDPSDIPDFLDKDVDIIRLWENWVEADIVEAIKRSGKQVWVMSGSPKDGRVGDITHERILQLNQMYAIDGLLLDKVEGVKQMVMSE